MEETMKYKITPKQLLEFYGDTLKKCGLFLLDTDEADIEKDLLQEFELGVNSFLTDNTLSILLEIGFINDIIKGKSSNLRKEYLAIKSAGEYNAKSVKDSKRWRNMMILSDELKILVATHLFSIAQKSATKE